MSDDFFREGGPYNARRTSADHMSYDLPIERDEFGRVARLCPNEQCSPGYFKVKMGTGITEGQTIAFCPYCRRAEEPGEFFTEEQIRYAKEILTHEAALAFQNAMKGALRGSDMITFKPGPLPHIHQPFEDTVQRDVICPHCGLDHAVFGLAIWCPDCGKDIFMTHVEAEYGVLRTMLGDVERRRQELGPRIGARDLENCLEDTVSIFEAVLKAMLMRHLRNAGESDQAIEDLLSQRIRNGFQSPERAAEIIRNRMQQDLFAGVSTDQVETLKSTFEKRHPITHNLGVIDKKYVERAMAAEQEGRDIHVTKEEIESAIALCVRVLAVLHSGVLGAKRTGSDNTGIAKQRTETLQE